MFFLSHGLSVKRMLGAGVSMQGLPTWATGQNTGTSTRAKSRTSDQRKERPGAPWQQPPVRTEATGLSSHSRAELALAQQSWLMSLLQAVLSQSYWPICMKSQPRRHWGLEG